MRIEYSPVRLALVTARNSPAELRVIKTLRKWGVYIDMAFFLGGVRKTEVLKALNPHIFFDDQDRHIDDVKEHIATGKCCIRLIRQASRATARTAKRQSEKAQWRLILTIELSLDT